MRAPLERRRERLREGEHALGWKLGFGAPAALERLALAAPLVGFLLRGSLVADGGTVSVDGWRQPVAEPELAVHLVEDVLPGAPREAVAAAIGALGPAIELADVNREPDDVEEILTANIFQRRVVLGRPDASRAGGSTKGLTGRVLLSGREVGATDEVEALTGNVVELVGHVAAVLAAFGERVRAGEVVIAGAIVPPLEVAPGDEIRFQLAPLGGVAVTLAP